MPKFPHSGFSANQSSGVFVKAQGSPSPMLEVDSQPEADFVHPFKVDVFNDGGTFKARVRAGTVNNIVPKEQTGEPLDSDAAQPIDMTDASLNRIYIKAASSSTPVFLPDTLEVLSDTNARTDTDSNGYLQIASVLIEIVGGGARKVTINQFVYASQVLVRAKPGTATALWSWSSR